ncbi:MAG: bifunctional glycosyltransferase family 2/GtrA family protein [Leptospiraceae bacterium]|nr:bifunctional glycosyltransferase family 2/GtrA family protein [Leptospiraceae bacterium]
MLITIKNSRSLLSPYLERLIARLVRAYAPRIIATYHAEPGALNESFGNFIPLKAATAKPEVLISADAAGSTLTLRKNRPQVAVILAFNRGADRSLRAAVQDIPGYEVRELFHFGAFTLPVIWLVFLPGIKSLARFLFSLEVRLHPYLNQLIGVGTVCVLQAHRKEPEKQPEIACVIPAYNEAERLPLYLPSVIRYFKSRKISHEIIVVDDGSRDNTAAVIHKAFPRVQTLRLYENSGKGAAVREGVLAASAKRILVCDADGATPITELPKLELALKTGADAAIGSRYLSGSEIGVKQNIVRRLVSRSGNLLIRLLLDLPYKDTQCGFKLFERRAAQYIFRSLANIRFGFDFEILKKAAVVGLTVAEVPVRWNDQAGSKVTFKQTLRVLNELIRFRFGHLIKFAVTGSINTFTDFAIHNTLILTFGNGGEIRQLMYMVAAFLCANLLAFTLHSGYTFKRRAAYRRFFTVSVFTLLISALIFHGLNLLYNPELSVLRTNLFKLSTVLISFITNYFGYKFWVYRYPM